MVFITCTLSTALTCEQMGYMDNYRPLTRAYIHTQTYIHAYYTCAHTPHTNIWLPWLAAASNMDWIIRQRWWEMWEGHNWATSPSMKRCLIRESSVHVLSEGVDSVEKNMYASCSVVMKFLYVHKLMHIEFYLDEVHYHCTTVPSNIWLILEYCE